MREKLMKNIRLMQMEQYIIEKRFVTIEDLCRRFDIHPNTARSDIRSLVERGVARKRYGGVEYVTHNLQISFDERKQRNAESKEQIGHSAAALLQEGDIIYVDTGSTASRLFSGDPSTRPSHLTVISSSLEVLSKVSRETEYTVFGLPGQLDRQVQAFVSLETIESLKSYNLRKAFLGTRGISARGELCSASSIDAKIKQVAIDISDEVILMADSQKVNQSSLFNFSNLDSVDYWACESDEAVVQELANRHGVKLLI